jgi:Flp pilus assembly protein TadG
MRTSSRRSQRGGLADLGPALWVLFLLLTFPLLDLATVTLRYTFLLGASRDAAQMASTAKTFQTNLDSADLSAENIASARAQANCGSFAGITYQSTTTYLVVTNLSTNAITTQSTPLNSPADTTNNLYQIKVVVNALVWPLLPYNNKYFGSIPGLTAPMQFSVPTVEVCENPSGMNQ